MATARPIVRVEDLLMQLTERELADRVRRLRAGSTGGCDACRFADPLDDRLCTVPDISPEDFDLGVSGIDCARFQPRP